MLAFRGLLQRTAFRLPNINEQLCVKHLITNRTKWKINVSSSRAVYGLISQKSCTSLLRLAQRIEVKNELDWQKFERPNYKWKPHDHIVNIFNLINVLNDTLAHHILFTIRLIGMSIISDCVAHINLTHPRKYPSTPLLNMHVAHRKCTETKGSSPILVSDL